MLISEMAYFMIYDWMQDLIFDITVCFIFHGCWLTKILFIICVVVDNGTRDGLDKFLKAASTDPETVLHYEFMQDYKVSLYHLQQL